MTTVQSHTRTAPDAVWTEVLPLWHAANGQVEEQSDVGFYMRQAAAAARPAVELGIGYGRVARWIRPEYGVDPSEGVLRRCVVNVRSTTPLVARAQDYELPTRAGFTYAPDHLMSLVGGEQQVVQLLANVHRNTRPRGIFAFDAPVPDWQRIRSRLDRTLPRGRVGEMLLSYRAELVSYDRAARQGSLRMHHLIERLDVTGKVCSRIHYPPVSVDYISPRRYRALLEHTGWRIVSYHGGFAGEPLTRDSRSQVWVVTR
ncbi:MAG TPA: class I SAM-dependent methyltransferase [Pseudonocardiaceae bacterium]